MSRSRSTMLAAAAAAAAALSLAPALAACGSSGAGSKQASAPSSSTTARIDPANFVSRVDNPWYPLKPGSTYRYRGTKDGKPAIDVMTVTHRTKKILGVPNVAVSDKLYLNGKLEETTIDWYTQDRQGNVWYFGERTAELDDKGRVVSREGSWQAGVDGAQPGIFMPAHPTVGQTFRQEYYKGHAEDHFTIASLSASVHVPYTSSSRAMRTTERTPLEPNVLDTKYYVRGIGTVQELQLKGPGHERSDLVSFKRG
jgi:hypothetical protein